MNHAMKKPHAARRISSRSIFSTILRAMLIVLAVELTLLILSLSLSKVTTQLDQNAVDILQKQVENRQNYLETIFLNSEELSALTDSINDSAQALLSTGDINLNTLDQGSDHCLPLMKSVSLNLLTTLRSKSVTGIFVMFSTHSLEDRAPDDILPCIYLRDLDSTSPASYRNSDLELVRAPAALVQSLRISTSAAWSNAVTCGSPEVQNAMYPVFQAALEDGGALAAADYGHWTTSTFTLSGDNHDVITYTVPLILPNGTVYGVLGIEMLESYVESLLPYGELQNEAKGSYLLLSTRSTSNSDTLALSDIICSTGADADSINAAPDAVLERVDSGVYRAKISGVWYGAAAVSLPLYSKNAPFSQEQWYLVGTVREQTMYAFSRHVLLLLSMSVFLTLLVGLISSLMIARSLSRPIARMSEEVVAAQESRSRIPTLSPTGIRELDRFARAFSQLSQDILSSSTKFLRIMDMASVEIGGYELRTYPGSPVSIYVTENFFPLLGFPNVDISALTVQQFNSILSQLNQICPHHPIHDGAELYAVTASDGSIRYVRMETTWEVSTQIGLVEDVTSTTLERIRIEHERDYDQLSSLYNRLAFQREYSALFRKPKQLKHGAFLMLDLDELKRTNDAFGHDWGDQYIRQTGLCIARHAPENALCARISGDEFTLFFYGYSSQSQIRQVILDLFETLRKTEFHLPNGRELRVSLSGGIAWYPESSTDPDTLRKYADFAMYQVKHSQKGRLEEFSAAHYQESIHANRVRKEFHHMLREELVTYHFQPIVSARTGEIVAYEALMRVDLPTIHSPMKVMRLAKEEHCLHDIERITLFKSAQAYLDLEDSGLVPPNRLLFVNSISSQYLNDGEAAEFCRRFQRLLPQYVTEITEEEELDISILQRKREFPGGSAIFALDDYGSGYNSEITLLALSPHYIKVDLSIIRDIDTDPNKQQIVSNIVHYAHQRNMEIIAEGLETASEVRKVIELGVDLLQGYFLAMPAAIPKAVSSLALEIIKNPVADASPE